MLADLVLFLYYIVYKYMHPLQGVLVLEKKFNLQPVNFIFYTYILRGFRMGYLKSASQVPSAPTQALPCLFPFSTNRALLWEAEPTHTAR